METVLSFHCCTRGALFGQRRNFVDPISGRKSRGAKQGGSFRAEIFTIIRTSREPGHSTSPMGERVSPDPAEIPTGREIRSVHSPRYRYRLSPRRRTRPSSFPKEWNDLERTQFHSEFRGHATNFSKPRETTMQRCLSLYFLLLLLLLCWLIFYPRELPIVY